MKIHKIFFIVMVLITVFGISFPIQNAKAAALTSVKDVMNTIAATANANHTISFVAPSAVSNGSTITLTFPAGFSLTGLVEDDIDIAGTTEGELTTAADCTGSEKASFSFSGQVITFTLCAGDGGDFTGSETITIEIGNHASASGTGSNQIDNPSAGDYRITIGGTMTDSGAFGVSIISDDSVNVTAQVNESITFTISDTTIGFGTITSSTGRWATSDTTGTDASATTPTSAHSMTIATNATGGYTITYNGATLTSGANTICQTPLTDCADVTDDSDGNPGTEQFGISVSTSGDATIPAAYLRDSAASFEFKPSTTTTIVSETGPTATETISTSYLGNITGTTEAGAYSTNITYIATGTF